MCIGKPLNIFPLHFKLVSFFVCICFALMLKFIYLSLRSTRRQPLEKVQRGFPSPFATCNHAPPAAAAAAEVAGACVGVACTTAMPKTRRKKLGSLPYSGINNEINSAAGLRIRSYFPNFKN